jgi:hypothetical protein
VQIFALFAAVFEIDDAAGKIWYRECFEADPHKTDWMVCNSHKWHPTNSLEHKDNVAANLKCQEAEAAGCGQYKSVYSTQTFANMHSGPSNIAPPSLPALFYLGDEMPDLTHSTAYDNVYDPFHLVFHSADVTPLA